MCDDFCGTPMSGMYEETNDEEEWDMILSGINEYEEAPQKLPPQGKQYTYDYGDVRVLFPYKAYASQEQMMEKLIQGVKTGQNCLLESPTGTGKTVALLCGALAFRQWCYRTQNFGHDLISKDVKGQSCSCGLITDPDNTTVTIVKSRYAQKFVLKATTTTSTQSQSHQTQSPKKVTIYDKIETQGSPNKIKKLDSPESSVTVKRMAELCMYCIKKHFKEFGPPKIYYATRTHSQIAQVVKQLKNTDYANVRMTILSSRQQTCINSDLKSTILKESQSQPAGTAIPMEPRLGLDEGCVTLKKNYYSNRREEKKALESTNRRKSKSPKPECPYFRENPILLSKFQGLQRRGAWDVEDLVEYGKSCDGCPFYGGQLLHEEAEIVFCPYNYLIHPDIRDNANVKLTNSIIIFDEAHNIEDICRSAASFCIDHDQLDIHVRRAFDACLTANIPPSMRPAVEHFSNALFHLSNWILNCGKSIHVKNNDTQPYISFLNTEILSLLDNIGFGPDRLDIHEKMFHSLVPDDEFEDPSVSNKQSQKPSANNPDSSQAEDNNYFKVPKEALSFVHEILSVLNLMLGNERRRLKDYKVVLVNTGKASVTPSVDNLQRNKYVLDILCLNPAVAFEPVKNAARSIIVASGTLSPMISFASELETSFPIALSANHVVSRGQVWAGAVKCGPSLELKLTKEFQGAPETQDEIGNVILQVCQVVPHGVLVFLPSYGFMNILKNRWSSYPTNNPLLSRIRMMKIVYFEESHNKEMFKKDINDYIENIKAPKSSSASGGCILFAVFRGKVSEGIDFADDQARAVITVGIPYSSLYSYDTVSKKAYNDTKLKQFEPNQTSKVLSGSEWYKVQAFRAINQGFGRCIRHQKDWGAIIMIDARLSEPKNAEYLSGWVQQHMRAFDDFKKVIGSLSAFVEMQLRIEEEVQSLSEDDNEDDQATQICQADPIKDALTQCCSKSTSGRHVLIPSSSKSTSKSNVAPADANTSCYSIDDFDVEDDYLFNDSGVQAAMDNAYNVHEQTTLPLDPGSDNSSISYHSESEAAENQNEADISIDMILGSP